MNGQKNELHKNWTLFAACLGTFMLLIDVTIVIVALPSIRESLHTSFSDVQWTIDAYSLTLTDAPDAFISFERAIAVQNVADLEPPRWFTSLLATHPPTAERIGSAVSFAGRSSNGSAAAAAGGYSSDSSGS